jgi:hypothetical protein
MARTFSYIHLTDDNERIEYDFYKDAGGTARHTIALGTARILTTRENLTRLAEVIAESMKEEDSGL